jgi:hypothetical protein
MRTGTITQMSPTVPVSHSDPSRRHGRRTRRRALAAIASATLVASSISGAAPVGANEKFDERCAPTASGSADSLERQVRTCLAGLDEAFVSCMRAAARTPDSAERWVEYCQTRALG